MLKVVAKNMKFHAQPIKQSSREVRGQNKSKEKWAPGVAIRHSRDVTRVIALSRIVARNITLRINSAGHGIALV